MTIYTVLVGTAYEVRADSEEEAIRLVNANEGDEIEATSEVIAEREEQPCSLCDRMSCICDYVYDSWKESQLERD